MKLLASLLLILMALSIGYLLGLSSTEHKCPTEDSCNYFNGEWRPITEFYYG